MRILGTTRKKAECFSLISVKAIFVMRSYLIIFIISILFLDTFAQDGSNVLVVTKDGMKNIPAYVREGTIYFSLKDFADAVGVNYYYNEDAKKIEVKFDKYSVKASAKNPFLVFNEKNGDRTISYSTSNINIFN